MRDLSKMSVPEMLGEGFICQCGKRHATDVEQVHIGPGMIEKLPQVLKSLGKSRFLLHIHSRRPPASAYQKSQLVYV